MPSLRRRAFLASVTVLIPTLLAVLLFAQSPIQTNQNQNSRTEQPTEYEVVAKGLVGTRPFRVQFQSAPLTLEFRNLVMGPGETETISAPTDIMMELRQGGITTNINQQSRDRVQGDFWAVEKGSSLSLKNRGEVAVIRAIYIHESSK